MNAKPTLTISSGDADQVFARVPREIFAAAYELELGEGGNSEFALTQAEGRWQLETQRHPEWKALTVDYTRGPGAERVRKAWLSRELLKDALNFRKGDSLNVVDATAGLLGDTLLLAAWGHRVTAFEQNPVLCFLGHKALDQLKEQGQVFDIELHCLPFVSQASIEIVRSRAGERAERVYLDPLYPARPKDALNSKELRIVAELSRGQVQPPLESMIEAALKLSPSRIVVKRPQWEARLQHSNLQVTSCTGRSTRFDIIHTSR